MRRVKRDAPRMSNGGLGNTHSSGRVAGAEYQDS
jgi:hypothetical protein